MKYDSTRLCEGMVCRVSLAIAKLRDPDYLSDMETFLRPGTAFVPESAWANVRRRLVEAL